VRLLQGLASLGLAAVGVWVLVLVGDPVAAVSSCAAFALLCVAWVVRPKRPHTDGPESHAEDRASMSADRTGGP